MKSHVVFQDGLPDFVAALKTWILNAGQAESVSDDGGRNIKAVLGSDSMLRLKNDCRTGQNEQLRAFRQAVFMDADGRCERVSGRLAEDERDMVEKLPAMAATPKSLASARKC